jgi:hypothetical protein
MFFAIHNPKLEEYINRKYKKATSSAVSSSAKNNRDGDDHNHTHHNPPNPAIEAAHILKNMIRCRTATSNIVYDLFNYAFIQQQPVTHLYRSQTSTLQSTSQKTSQTSQSYIFQIIRSHQSGHLKTTASRIKQLYKTPDAETTDYDAYRSFIEYIMSTQSPALCTTNINEICDKMKKMNYKRKDIIFLAVVTYMKIHDDNINKQTIFISLTDEETKMVTENTAIDTATDTATDTDNTTPQKGEYDNSYQYLLS